jgi:hypothetical protein
MWRELVNNFNLALSANVPVWTRDDKSVHQHFKRFGDDVVRLLRRQHELSVFKVNANVRKYLKHGDAPSQDNRRRTADFYRSCIPSPSAKTFGIVIFPRDTDVDHPLIVASLGRRGKITANSLETAVANVDTANDLGNLSWTKRQEIRGQVNDVVGRALKEKHPLFPRTPKEIML